MIQSDVIFDLSASDEGGPDSVKKPQMPKASNMKCAGHVVYLKGAGQIASSPERAVMAGIS